MKIKFNSKYNTIAFYVVAVFSVCILLILLAFRLGEFINIIRRILTAIAPVIWGFAIAYLMFPMVRKIENILNDWFGKKKKKNNRSKKGTPIMRSLSILISSLITWSVIIALIAMAVPDVLASISSLFDDMPKYLNNLYNIIVDFMDKNPKISSTMTEWFEDQFEDIEKTVLEWVTTQKPTLEKYFILLRDGVFDFLIGVKDFLLGYIVSIYLMYSKEHFLIQFKKLAYAVLPKKIYDVFMVKGSHANKIFSDFLVGKALDSLIIGMLCFIILVIFGFQNAMLISFIVGITNIIPFFGPFIGAIPSSLLVLLTSPDKTLLFIILIFVIQQFDGNLLGPKILGNKLNLPTFWIIFSIFFFGNLFGFAGMIAGVPIFAVLYTLTKEFIEERIRIKNRELLAKGVENGDDLLEPDEYDIFAPDSEIFGFDEETDEQDYDSK